MRALYRGISDAWDAEAYGAPVYVGHAPKRAQMPYGVVNGWEANNTSAMGETERKAGEVTITFYDNDDECDRIADFHEHFEARFDNTNSSNNAPVVDGYRVLSMRLAREEGPTYDLSTEPGHWIRITTFAVRLETEA